MIALVVVAALVWSRGGDQMATETPSASPSAAVSVSPSASPVVAKPVVKATPLPTNYGDAVVQFEGRRIQFDMYCQANPVNNTYKNGTSVMFDNRSGDARIITVGGVQHSLAGYGWKIITLSSKTLPATLAVDCGAARNVSKILIQQ